jgi:hypothetical protein
VKVALISLAIGYIALFVGMLLAIEYVARRKP